MTDSVHQLDPSLLIAMIGVLTLLCQWLAWRTSAPSILFLLAAGILVGPVFNLLSAEALLGDLLFPVVSLSVAVILFEGSLTLRFHELKDTGSVLWRMLSLGVLVTWVTLAVAVHYLVGLDWPMAILFGAIMVVTGPTVIGPMLRAVRPNQRISRLLRWEGIVIDPIGAVLAIVVFNIIVADEQNRLLGGILMDLGAIAGVGLIGGAAAGHLLGLMLRNYWLPEYLHNVATLLVVLTVFVLTDSMVHESGLLAVTVMGIWLANMPGVHTEDILDFKESLSVLLISALFILLASRLNLQALASIGWQAFGVFLVVQLVARPLKIFVSTVPSDLSWPERGLLSYIAPRGIVAAAISSLFALRLEEINYPGAELIVPLAFALIIGTVVWQGLTAPIVARALGVAEPDSKGVLFVGGNPVSMGIAQRLHDAGFNVTLADSSWDTISQARMAGFGTYFGNAVSEHAERHLSLTGLGTLFAMSRRDDLNALSCQRFRYHFGRNAVFSLATRRETQREEKHSPAATHSSQELFGKDISFSKLASLVSGGAEFRQTRITDEYSYTDVVAERPGSTMLLAWNESLDLMINTEGKPFQPGNDWTVLSLAPISDSSSAAVNAPSQN